MFPIRKLLRLILTLSFLCLSVIFLYTSLINLLTISSPFTSPQYFTDDPGTLKSRLSKEIQYQSYLANMTQDKITRLSKLYRRDVKLQLSGRRRLLPSSTLLYDMKCLKYIENEYNAQVSIILPYYNELPVLLLRTLTTIHHRTPLRYLREILLIDDASTQAITEEVKQFAMEQKMRVRFLKNEKRLGIADSRRKGIKEAVGDVIVILDTHMEVNEFWLEPLLSIISTNPAALAVPTIHMIQEDEYDKPGSKLPKDAYIMQSRRGYGHVNMYSYSSDLNARARREYLRERWEPMRSPSLMGGGIVARKDVLLEIYPSSLINSAWGIENARISFRAWLCGDGIFVSPCSQVLHPNGNDPTLKRYFDGQDYLYDRLVWENAAELSNFMRDQSKIRTLFKKVAREGEELKQITAMAEKIRGTFDAKKCRDYEWYLDNVYASYVSWERDQFIHVGEVRSAKRRSICLEPRDRKLKVWNCRPGALLLSDTHTLGFSKNGAVLNGDLDGECWDSSNTAEREEISFRKCHLPDQITDTTASQQHFRNNTETQQIRHVATNRCLELVIEGDSKMALLMKCSDTSELQQWEVIPAPWF